jgi:small GTP-binding protein
VNVISRAISLFVCGISFCKAAHNISARCDHHPMTVIVTYKFIIVGSSGVGKTALLKRLIDDSWTDDSQSTIGVEFDSTVVNIGDRKVKLQIWDTAGQERFRSIAKAYYRNAVGVLVVFDLTDRKTFDDVNNWMNDIHALCDPNAVVQLIGNKSDMNPKRTVTVHEAEEYASHQRIQYMETSAKAGSNVRDAFIKVAAAVLGKSNKAAPPVINQNPLLPRGGTAQQSDGCC